jgi:ribosomal protein S18 acetylase RimI-like enzyme
MTIPNTKVLITEPVLEKDYQEALRLVEANLFKGGLSLDDLKSASCGELLVAKAGEKVIGMLRMWYPGTAFSVFGENHFFLEKIGVPKRKVGYIALISVSEACQGRGVGKKLVQKAIKYQSAWGARAVIVHASQNSPGNASEKLFAFCGLRPVVLHKAPWLEYSREAGPKKFLCVFCGNPCRCDELEMVLQFFPKKNPKN